MHGSHYTLKQDRPVGCWRETCYVFKTESPSPWAYLTALNGLRTDEKICQQSVGCTWRLWSRSLEYPTRIMILFTHSAVTLPSTQAIRAFLMVWLRNTGTDDGGLGKICTVDAIQARREVSEALASWVNRLSYQAFSTCWGIVKSTIVFRKEPWKSDHVREFLISGIWHSELGWRI